MPRSRLLWSLGVLLILCEISVPRAGAEVPDKLEPDYSEAVLAYNAKNFSRALALLNTLLKTAPNTAEFLELKALALKATNDTKESAATYVQLIEQRKRDKKSEKDMAPYHFELAMIRYRDKQLDQAKTHFRFSLRHGFNEAVCNLYLGMMAFQAGRWGEAEEEFREATASDADELRPASYFYLGQTYLKTEYPGGATESFATARRLARAQLDDSQTPAELRKTAQQIFEATERSLAPFDRGQFFGSIGLLTGYDSNVLAMPSTVTSDDQTSRKASMKQTLMLGVGYATSPLGALQFVPSYRGTFNYLDNSKARSFEFYDHTISLYMTRHALLRTSYGIKAEGTLIFKNEVASTAGATAFDLHLYSKTASIGPYLKHQFSRELLVGFEAFYQPQSFVGDPAGDLSRSGTDYVARAFLQRDTGSRFWNPSVSLRFDTNRTNGAEYRATTFGGEVSDLLRLGGATDLTAALSVARTSYSSRPQGARNDLPLAVRLVGSHKLSKKWRVLGTGDYTWNMSNLDDSYGYKRLSLSMGITYAL